MTPSEFKSALEEKLSLLDKEGAAIVCKELESFLYQSSQSFDITIGEKILQLLRNKRMFEWMHKISDALIFTERRSLKIFRQYAQSLIDSGDYGAARSILNDLNSELKNASPDNKVAKNESNEAEGLMGRLYKQLYINAAILGSFNSQFLKKALQPYYDVYQADEGQFWHGINAVALLHRAETDGVVLDGFPEYYGLAKKILSAIQDKYDENNAQTWDYATAAEACIALGKPDEAEKWIAIYVSQKGTDAFELGSTLRQFEEVWKLDLNSEAGKKVLPILRSELLKRQGGGLIISAEEIQQSKPADINLEKNFGNNVFIDFRSYKMGYACCESVARIGKSTLRGDGTGFLIKGSDLKTSLGNEWLLITNAHVINTDPGLRANGALHPDEAIIVFEALDDKEKFRVNSILFTSPPMELDCTIISFRPDEMDRLKNLTKNVMPYKVTNVLPVPSGNPLADPRLYVIGHPKGGPLQFSMQDNLLLDIEVPRIHYRTPTEPGNSGSPVFNQQWELIALHHGGKKDMKKLNGKEGTYEANEGLSIKAIIEKFNQ